MEITVKHEITFSPVLETFLTSLLTPKTAVESVKKTPVKEITKAAEVKAEAVVPVTEKIEEVKAEPKRSDITVEQLRAVASEKAKAGKREDLKAVLTDFGAENITTLAVEKYADFLNAINAL